MSDDEKVYNHESYGQASFSRRQSSGWRRFYGSSLTNHFSTIVLRVARSERAHKLSCDWYRERGELIEVEFTAAQFAELLTTMNVGSGIPCTINHVAGKRMEEPPAVETEAEAVRIGFSDDMREIVKQAKTWRGEMERTLDGAKGITKATREAVMSGIGRIVQHLESNVPFVVESFQKAAAKTVSAAKAEVDAFVLHRVIQAGLAHVRELGASADNQNVTVRLLGEGDDPANGAP